MRRALCVRTVLVIPVLIAVASMFAILIQLSLAEQADALDRARTSLRDHVQLMANDQQALLDSARDMLTPLGRAVFTGRAKPETCNTYLREVNELFPRYSHLGFAKADGNVVCRSSTNLKLNHPGFRGDLLV